MRKLLWFVFPCKQKCFFINTTEDAGSYSRKTNLGKLLLAAKFILHPQNHVAPNSLQVMEATPEGDVFGDVWDIFYRSYSNHCPGKFD